MKEYLIFYRKDDEDFLYASSSDYIFALPYFEELISDGYDARIECIQFKDIKNSK